MNVFGSVITLFILFILCLPASAQNLVPNGSFESFSVCPGSYSRLPAEFRVTHWRSISTGSPDYFNMCSRGEASVPYNWAGVSDAFDGQGYVGIYTWMNLPKEYREYIHCKLAVPLIKDSLYRVEFRYKLSSYSKFCTDRIGLLLSDSLATFAHDRPLGMTPTFTFVKDSALTKETGAWELAVAEYKAKGGERFLTIGNFSDNASTHYYRIQYRPAAEPMLAESAYYYIDDVKVIPKGGIAPGIETPPFFDGVEAELNRVYVLQNIQFEFNSYALMPVSFGDLDRVVNYLHAHPDISVRLSGHTDDVGGVAYNYTLSARRAKRVGDYLVSKGIDRRRISTRGYGETQPLLAEFTATARALNRRVEIEFFR